MNKYAVQLEMSKGKVEEILEKLTAAQETIREYYQELEDLDQAPSKLKHRALYCKRWRIRKKYLDRIQREYREKKEG